MKYLLSFLLLSGCYKSSDTEHFDFFLKKSFERSVKRSPQFQTYIGRKDNYDKWDDISDARSDEEIELTKKDLEELKKIDITKLKRDQQTSYLLFKLLAERDLELDKYRHHNYPVNQMFGLHTNIVSFLINMHRISNIDDANAYIERLKGVKNYMQQIIEHLKIRENKGIIAPKFVYPKTIEASLNIISGAPFDKSNKVSPLLEDFTKKVNKLEVLNEKIRTDLIERARTALVNRVQPAYLKLVSYLEELEKKAPTEGGVSAILPNGADYYESQLRKHTTTDYTAEEVHQIGLNEVKRIQDEMRKIMKQVGYKGNLKSFFTYMKDSPEQKYPNTEEGKNQYLEDSRAAIDNMKKRLGELFHVFPKADLTVKAVEPFREKSAGRAFYQSPAKDGSRPGIYYVNLYDMESVAKYELEALAYHEGIPGHHMQRAISIEAEIPDFRKYVWVTAYGEGWALYSELIPKEIGLYTDPYQDFGRLSMELWRACRLVVDTGLHYKKWSLEKSKQYLRDNTPSSELDISKSIERYAVMPGQATAYKIGMLKILELRKMAKDKLKDKFDIRSFHDEVLRHGTIPLSLLETLINEWINKGSQ